MAGMSDLPKMSMFSSKCFRNFGSLIFSETWDGVGPPSSATGSAVEAGLSPKARRSSAQSAPEIRAEKRPAFRKGFRLMPLSAALIIPIRPPLRIVNQRLKAQIRAHGPGFRPNSRLQPHLRGGGHHDPVIPAIPRLRQKQAKTF